MACRAIRQRVCEVKIHSEDDRLCLWVAHPAIKLEHARSFWSEHQAKIKESAVGTPVGGHTSNGWLYDVSINLRCQGRREQVVTRVSAHATRVRTKVAVEGALVVTGGRHERG